MTDLGIIILAKPAHTHGSSQIHHNYLITSRLPSMPHDLTLSYRWPLVPTALL